MKVIVASRNPVKIRAVERAFSQAYGETPVEVHGISVASGVSDQPVGDEETRRGAVTRVANAREQCPEADCWVGMEGGIERIDGALQAFAWMVVCDRSGRQGAARSVSLPLPPAVSRLLDEGCELGEANDRVFATRNSKQSGGAFGLLTEGRHTRASIYTQTLTMALIPLRHRLFVDTG